MKMEVIMSEVLEEFYSDCVLWEDRLKGHCCTVEEQKIIHNAFVRMKDNLPEDVRVKLWDMGVFTGHDSLVNVQRHHDLD